MRLRRLLLLGLFIAASWGLGRLVWDDGLTDGFGTLEPSVAGDVLPFLLLLLLLLAGVRLCRASTRPRRVLGTGLLVTGVAALAFGAFMSSFGGICLDPGDVCLVSASAHAAHLLTPLAVLVLSSVVVGSGAPPSGTRRP